MDSIRMAGGGEPGTTTAARRPVSRAVVSQHPIFKRQDTNIYSTVPISLPKAALGRMGPIHHTADGEVEYEVNQVPDDTKVRLKRKRFIPA